MQTIKLEVGKTYRSRQGKEIKIVGFDKRYVWPYYGSDGRCYADSGQWSGMESPYDLIEEAPKTSRTFDIPNGVKKVTVSQEGNRIIVEMVPEAKEPKPGDIVFEEGRVMIVKKYPNRYHAMIHGNPDYLYINGSYGIPFTSATFRLATAEETQLLFDALKKAGKRWNAQAMQVEDVAESDHIREWVKQHLVSGTYNQEGIAGVIEAYLKHKEGEKMKAIVLTI